MRLDPTEIIAGRYASQVREVLRAESKGRLWMGRLGDVLGYPLDEARHVLEDLEEAGYLRTEESCRLYFLTAAGRAIAGAELGTPPPSKPANSE